MGRDKRLAEIRDATGELKCPVVPVIPVVMLESWLLVDGAAIRGVAGNPTGRMDLDLPDPRKVERDRDPKQRLRAALEVASGKTGRRLAKVRQRFGKDRALLAQRLDPDGPVNELQSWQALIADVARAVRQL